MKVRGWVYVITNKAMPNLVKIGFSTKDPRLRALELNHTGIPHPYLVEYDLLVTAPFRIEQQVHMKLQAQREGKEWFRMSVADAIRAIREIAGADQFAERLLSVSQEPVMIQEQVDCSHPGCRRKADSGQYYCSEHLRMNRRNSPNRQYAIYQLRSEIAENINKRSK
ncbi:GIY-YIG nuclease family protein [Pandoraea sp. B-6]|uniref:GIY-YIG nuclease family protein n=1 Tax=Pandoraea sp. B-6 TaxID=1204340 RepID=UPI0012FBECF0|nr:GIY-YIG nuclease family protein [Pandoraea sp. B-6]